jgi:Protein of unknown function (DUF1203)
MTVTTESSVLHYVAIPNEVAARARRTGKDAFGHNIQVLMEHGPCRSCLRISEEPEEFLLLSYQPLPDRNPYAEVGPIFIHARECEPYSMPEQFPADFARRELVVRAYDNDGRIADATVAKPGEAPAAAAHFLSDPTVAEVHVRHTSYTCFDFKVVRARV